MVHEEWLEEDDVVVTKRMFDFYIAYIEYVTLNYEEIDVKVRNEIKKEQG